MQKDRRKYIRHPSDIPIKYTLTGVVAGQKQPLNNISVGGISFQADRHIEKGTTISIQIDLIRPSFKGKTIVVWCQKKSDHYDLGVRFIDHNTGLRAYIVEQVCHIEQYKREVLEKEGRKLSGEEAAVEWINKYSKDFP